MPFVYLATSRMLDHPRFSSGAFVTCKPGYAACISLRMNYMRGGRGGPPLAGTTDWRFIVLARDMPEAEALRLEKAVASMLTRSGNAAVRRDDWKAAMIAEGCHPDHLKGVGEILEIDAWALKRGRSWMADRFPEGHEREAFEIACDRIDGIWRLRGSIAGWTSAAA